MARKWLEYPINRKKVLRILKMHNLTLAPPRRRTDKLEGRKADQTAPLPNQKWQGDMTKIWCGIDGWGYLVNIIDCCTREWIGYHFSLRCSTDETLSALHMAVSSRFNGERPRGLTLRTDNGPQLTSRRFEKALRTLSIVHETTHFNCPDENALVESFHAALKRDCVYLHDFESFEHARLVIEKYFNDYNNIFPHGSLRMMAPAEYAKTLTNNQAKSVLI
jgi:putative transposase